MSVAVGLDKLRDEVERFGPVAYLLTVADDGRPHAVSVRVSWEGDALRAAAGRTTAANARQRPAVSVLWPSVDGDGEGYSLIVDGQAEVGDERLTVRPTRAVLHRSRQVVDAAVEPGSDCVTVL